MPPAAACTARELIPGFEPENDLERALASDRDLLEGLAWGSSRFGHPEGAVGRHVAAILAEIDLADPLRADLRAIALVHDSQKVRVDPAAGYSPANDHARLARRLAERHTGDKRLLCAIELHDEPYWIWRSGNRGRGVLAAVLRRMPDVALFARFVELDASTEGKDPSFLWWFQREIATAAAALAHPAWPAVPPSAGPETYYVKTFLADPGEQAAVAAAAEQVVREHASRLAAQGSVLLSEDGSRVLLIWRWYGATPRHLLADGDVVARALESHPVLAAATALEARLFRPRDA